MLKAKRPESETWNKEFTRAGVARADCQMPCKRVGGFKISQVSAAKARRPGGAAAAMGGRPREAD